MAHWCESCGQRLPEGEIPADATWIGAPGDDHQHSFAKPAGAKKSGRDKKLLGAVVAAVAVWGLFVGIGRIVTPDEAIDEQAAAEIEQDRLDDLAEEAVAAAEAEREAEREEARIAEVEGDYGAADAAPGFPDADRATDPDAPIDDGRAEPVVDAANLGARTAVSVQVERLQRQLSRRESTAFVAYRSDVGIVLIDMVNGQAVVGGLTDTLALVEPGDHLLRSGAATYGIDPDTLQVSQVGEGSSLVLSDALDGNTYFVDAKSLTGQAAIVEVVSDGEYKFHRMPAGGFQLQPVDGLGLLAVPKGPTGETLIARSDSFETFSVNRVLTGTDQAILEQICVSESSCALAITKLETGQVIEVPASFVRFGDQYSLSPNGDMLLRYSPEGFAEVFVSGSSRSAGNDTIAWVIGAGMRSPAWGPNSDFIVWLDRIGDPKLKVMFPDERDWLTIDLRDVGAPVPASPEVIVFTPTATDAQADG